MNKELISKNEEVLMKLLKRLEKEATKEPMNTINVSALSDAIKILKML